MASNTKQHPALGKMPRAAKGSCGPGMGGPLASVDNTRMNPTAYAGGKAHGSIKDIKRTKNPAPISHAVTGGKTVKVAGW